MTDPQILDLIRAELSRHHLFGLLPAFTVDTVLDPRWFGPVDRCCVAIEISEQFGAEVPDAEIEAWRTAGDIVASARKLDLTIPA